MLLLLTALSKGPFMEHLALCRSHDLDPAPKGRLLQGMDCLTQAVLSQAPASMTSSDTLAESRSSWQSFKQRGQVNVIAHLCQKEGT